MAIEHHKNKKTSNIMIISYKKEENFTSLLIIYNKINNKKTIKIK